MLRDHPLRVGLILVVGMLFLFFIVPAACGGSSGDDDDDSDASQESLLQTGGAAMATATTGGGSAFTDASTDGAQSSAGESGAPANGSSAAVTDWNRMIVRNASITLTVTDVEGAVAWVRGIATGKGGFVFSSSSYVDNDRQIAQLTIRVPVERFDETMSELRAGQLVDEVEREESSSQDVSAEFVDNQSRLAALSTTYDRLLALLGEAESIDDILRLEFELQNVRGEMETIQGRQNYLQDVTSFSNITVALYPTGVDTTARAEPAFSVSDAVANAWERARGTVEATLTAAITIVIFALVFAPVAAVLYGIFRLGRGLMRRFAT